MNIKERNKIVIAICRCILFKNTKVLIACQDNKSLEEFQSFTSKICNLCLGVMNMIIFNNTKLLFTNGSKIEFAIPIKDDPNDTIRGYRAKYVWEDLDYISNDALEEAIKPFIKLPKTRIRHKTEIE